MKDHPFTDAEAGDSFTINGEDYMIIRTGWRRYDIRISRFLVPIVTSVSLTTAREWLAEKAGYGDD